MPQQYIDNELQEKLKEMAKQEKQTVVAVLRRLVGIEVKSSTAVTNTPAVHTPPPVVIEDAQVSSDPNVRWEWTKGHLGKKCGCTFDDDMLVCAVSDWGLFRTINNGKLMEKYLLAHPEERDKYTVAITETNEKG